MQPRKTPPEETPYNNARLAYLPGLDGVRALAVVAVMVYHAGLPLRGGFLGVEVFFVLSGYLITALLLAEWQHDGRVDLLAFWRRRARRLLPALSLLLLGTLLLTLLFVPHDLAPLAVDLLAALGFVMNWQLITTERSYFDPLLRPPLLQHLWSLAVEEQFYLLWPLLFVGGIRLLRPLGLLLATLAVAGASVALMAASYTVGADPSRVYYGTDTRASALLLGAALALAGCTLPLARVARRNVGLALDIAGSLALLGLLGSFVLFYATHPLLYRGGFALVALLSLVVVASVAHPQARLLSLVLGNAPLRWVGLRSYSLYLWHWPVFMLTRPGLDLAADSWVLQAARFGVVVLLADLSYRYVELPVRRGALARLRQQMTDANVFGALRRLRYTRAMRVGAALLVIGAACAAPSSPQQPAVNAAHGDFVAAPPAAPATKPTVTLAAQAHGPPHSTATPQPTVQTTTLSATATGSPTATIPPTPAPFDPALAATLQAIVDETIATTTIPGIVLAVQLPGREAWVGASGEAHVATGEPMAPTTLVRLASVSKLFTAIVVLQLVEEGKLDLDAPVATYLPDVLPDGEAITVRHLLQHRSGLYDYLEDIDFVSRAYRDPERIWAPEELVDYATGFPLAFAPGREGNWDYSSTNYVVLGMLIEQVTGNSYPAELRARVLAPLELNHTFVAPFEASDGPQAHGYAENVDHTRVAMSFVFATGSLVSTAGDLQRCVDALFNGRLLKPSSLAAMATFVDGNGQYGMPDLAYGLGLMYNRLPLGPGPEGQERSVAASEVLGHIGGFGGFRSAVWHAPEHNITIALSINQSMTDPNPIAAQILDAILTSQGR